MNPTQQLLKKCTLFAGLDDSVIDEILNDATQKKYAKDAVLINKGEVPSALFVIISGKVGIYSEDVLLGELRELTTLGESLLADTTATATIVAQTDIEAVSIAPDHLRQLTYTYPKIMHNIFSTAMNHLRNSNDAAMEEAHSREKDLKDQVEQRTRDLNTALEDLKQTQKYKDQFLANMSHEIRTPMNAVLGLTNLTLGTELDGRQKKYLSAVKKSSENLLTIINDILDMSKIEAGKMELESIPFEVREQIKQVYDTLRFKSEEKGLIFSHQVENNVPLYVIGDPTRLVQILINLCGNAIKFTEKGMVTIEVEADSDNASLLTFKVSDTGIGISDEQIKKLFNPFQQADTTTTRKFGGTGLGLSISKSLIEQQGGTIGAESKEGAGTTFFFTIPYKNLTTDYLKKDKLEEIDHAQLLEGIRVLIAEDNEFNQMVVEDTILANIENAKVEVAANGEEAISLFEKEEFDIILMDNQMPIMDGMAATRYIRNEMGPDKKSVPIMALTASVLPLDLKNCLEAGMNDIIPKPFQVKTLLNTLSRYYSSSKVQTNPKEVEEESNATQPSLIDINHLMDICKGNTTLVKKYLGMFKDKTPSNVSVLKEALLSKDEAVLLNTIHTMKAHLSLLGMDATRDLAIEIEGAVKSSGLDDDSITHIHTFINQCDQSISEINTYKNDQL